MTLKWDRTRLSEAKEGPHLHVFFQLHCLMGSSKLRLAAHCAALLVALFAWVMVLLLLMETTRQILDVLHYVVELAQMS